MMRYLNNCVHLYYFDRDLIYHVLFEDPSTFAAALQVFEYVAHLDAIISGTVLTQIRAIVKDKVA